jgi:hypothetical protein
MVLVIYGKGSMGGKPLIENTGKLHEFPSGLGAYFNAAYFFMI